MRRMLQIGALALGVALFPVQEVEAQVGFGAQGTYDFAGDGSFGVGARASAALPAIPIGVLGTFDYFFADPDAYWELSASGIFDFALPDVGVSPYVGAGLNYANFEFGSDTGWQVLGGVNFGFEGMLSPFVELKMVNHIESDLQISAGVNF